MLEQATEFPFDEELTHEASMLRELRFKVTDDTEVSQQITEVLALYDAKKKELAGEVKANQAAQAAQEAQVAQAAQARTDSISAAQLLQSEEEKKNMLWIGGGIAGLIALFMGGKQIFQMVNQISGTAGVNVVAAEIYSGEAAPFLVGQLVPKSAALHIEENFVIVDRILPSKLNKG